MLRKLDVPIPCEGQIHIHSLENADAEDIAQTTLTNFPLVELITVRISKPDVAIEESLVKESAVVIRRERPSRDISAVAAMVRVPLFVMVSVPPLVVVTVSLMVKAVPLRSMPLAVLVFSFRVFVVAVVAVVVVLLNF